MVFSDLLPYICALLSLLLVWQYHRIQVLTGRIQAVDIFDRSGNRMYLYATPDDEEICESCREVNGMVFVPSRVARGEFTPLRRPCSNEGRCTVVMVGLYAAWPEANHILRRLRATEKEGFLHLSREQLIGLTKGSWQASVSASTDRLAVLMLTALSSEKLDPVAAISGYQEVIQQAHEVRDLPMVVPAYLRLTYLLERYHRVDEAVALTEDFEKRFPPHKTGPYDPNATERGLLTIKASHLRTALHVQTAAAKQLYSREADSPTTKSLA